ncbi:M56 family metallopeptidase [Clostridioides difficile]|uniref:M56 family metallopeptidase n=1 Tax=Clostridioides difficile TaxID=1496 RepID=UPI0003B295A0|nr:M56 family metallopeptidase [Clostridioides difficile]EJX3466178.1 M56 family metallopeptidase [Clostridioides difficile]EKS6823753.1 M56 family metallopeptidase [Clostridioides difficile]MBY2760281.1 M56 family metallopeptidase [Clostridioides difficile]MCI0948381.1 M56 family metallopeptidase [Clostridioides difficile]MCP3318194.1 M56 family metallopeptidase [Clostridioides difficile]
MVSSFLNDIFRTILVSCIFIVILLVFRITLFKTFSKKFNYYIWLIVIIKLSLPFMNYTFIFNESKYNGNINKISLGNFNSISIVYSTVLVSVWIAITIFYLVYTLLKYIKLKNMINDLSYDVEDDKIKNLYENLLKELKINKKIRLKYSYEVESPVFFNSCVILPPCDYTLKELNWIFRHELMHFKSKDLYIKYLVIFLKCVYWFNPFVYIMEKFIDLDCEFYCDERVLKNCTIEEKQDYALIIISAMRKGSNSSNKFVAGLHKESDIKKRVFSMFNEKYRNGILIAVILCLLSSITYFEIDLITTKSIFYPLSKQTPIENRTNSKPTYQINVYIDN